MTPTWWGAVAGAVLGAGLVCVLYGLPFLRRPDLSQRLAPYLRDAAPPSRLLPSGDAAPGSVLIRLVIPGAHHLGARLGARLGGGLGGTTSVHRRLERAGRSPDVEAFRAEQVLWAVAGLVLGGASAALMWWRSSTAVVPLVVLVAICGAAGLAGRDWYLTQEAQGRERRMLAEFPAVAELLALAVGAGAGPVGALERVTVICHGDLATELRRTLVDARAGASLVQALQALSARTGLVPLARFVDGVVIAVERGTPLADVLRAQAQDVRLVGQRALMDTAGRKEIAMMIPVVFAILPITVLFAVYPGFAFLRLGL